MNILPHEELKEKIKNDKDLQLFEKYCDFGFSFLDSKSYTVKLKNNI